MRLVALVLTLASLSVGCAIEAGDPSVTEEPQTHEGIAAVAGSAKGITPVAAPTTTSVPVPAPHMATVTPASAIPATGPGETSGTAVADNPNPSPWDPHGNGSGP
jgi:hypothetical protein